MALSSGSPRAKTVQELEKVLIEESALHTAYRDLLDKEREELTKFDSEKVAATVESRQEVVDRLKVLQDRRIELTAELAGEYKDPTTQTSKKRGPQPAPLRLTEAIERFCDSKEKARLKPLIEGLKAGVAESRQDTKQANQLTTFALGIVNGLISNIRSATENVVQTYTQRGDKRQAFNPGSDRHKGVIKEA